MDTWDHITTWHLVLPPSRPSAGALGAIREVLRDRQRTERVGVLGSTPEFRDLLHEQHFTNVAVLERNTHAYEMMSRLRVYGGSEQLIAGDWRDTLPRCREQFDILLSDLTSGNIPYDDRRAFYASIARALTSGGLFIDRCLTHLDELLSLTDLEAKYRQRPLNLQEINRFSCEAFFCSELLARQQIVDTTAFYNDLDDRFREERLKRFLRETPAITPRDCTWYYGRPWAALRDDYGANLSLRLRRDEEQDSPYLGRAFLYVFQKEQQC